MIVTTPTEAEIEAAALVAGKYFSAYSHPTWRIIAKMMLEAAKRASQ